MKCIALPVMLRKMPFSFKTFLQGMDKCNQGPVYPKPACIILGKLRSLNVETLLKAKKLSHMPHSLNAVMDAAKKVMKRGMEHII